MLRIAKLTDYAVALATRMAARPDEAHSVTALARETAIPVPTVSKLCKLLAGGGVIVSRRGVRGGYRLRRAPSQISLAGVIAAIEGPIGITECARQDGGCDYEEECALRSPWQQLSRDITAMLEGVSLEKLAASLRPARVTGGGHPVPHRSGP